MLTKLKNKKNIFKVHNYTEVFLVKMQKAAANIRRGGGLNEANKSYGCQSNL